MRLTPDQQRAVTTLEGDVAVRAGAGSGKTSVLARRFAHALVEGVEGVRLDPDRLLTITFTTKAAAEVAERVRAVVRAEISAEQARLIDQGWISTIHSFCARLVRRHLLEAGLDGSFGQADETTADALKGEAFERAALSCLDDDPDLAALFDAISLRELKARVLACHDRARTLGLDPMRAEVRLDRQALADAVAGVANDAAALLEILEGQRQTPAVVTSCETLAEWAKELSACPLDGEDCDAVLAVCSTYAVRVAGEAKTANARLKESIKRTSRMALAFRHEREMQGIERMIRSYTSLYRDIKRERGLLDFDDLQELAVSLLESEPRVAEVYREHFRLMMVDEFQDTNALQMRALAPLRADNLCVVGDERQSIYGFRYADVRIFAELAQGMEHCVGLRTNFRSHGEVLDFVNHVFGSPVLFGEGFMRLDAGRESNWKVGDLDGMPRVECVFVHNGEKVRAARLAEAEWMAERIETLLRGQCEPGDVAILLRAATHADLYAAALERRGIPVLVSAGASLFDAPEIEEVTALLRALAVPEDDEALLSVLSGRIVACTDRALLAVSRAAGRRSLWSGLELLVDSGTGAEELDPAESEALAAARSRLASLAALQGRMPLGELVERACEAFDYDLTLHAQGPEGPRAWANVLKLARLAEAFERTEGNDAAEFVEHLRLRGEAAPDKPAPGDSGERAVRIMTVHAAKGLEFPVVFVADLAVAQKRGAPSVLVEAEESAGGAVPVVGVRLPADPYGSATTPDHVAMAESHVARETEEEKRCLYVACTRAEELLVVSGACDLDKDPEEGTGVIDWVREALSGLPDGVELPSGARVQVRELRPEPIAEEGRAEVVPGPLEPVAPPHDFEGPTPLAPPPLPSSVSYSALHLFERCPLSFRAVYGLRMGRLAQQEASGPLAFGSAVHAALRVAVTGHLDDARLTAISRAHSLGAEDRGRLEQAVASFMASGVAVRMRSAERIATEQPLLVALPDTVLTGAIDLIAWEGDGAVIVDYKTGRAPTDPSSDREEAYRLQADCYALAALEAGAECVEVCFAFVEHAGAERWFRYGGEDAAVVRESLETLVARIASGEAGHLAEYRPEVCGACPALGCLCPVSERRTR